MNPKVKEAMTELDAAGRGTNPAEKARGGVRGVAR